MEITGKVHCFFEQSGTFKNEFVKLGIPAEDYDIQNNFGETDNVVDLFAEIEKGYENKPSIFDQIGGGDLIMAFFPCIYFCENNQLALSYHHFNYRNLNYKDRTDKIIERMKNREYFYSLICKMCGIVMERNIKMVLENPWNGATYLKQNFVTTPTIVDNNRMLRGDYFSKPTAYWFFNCTPTYGLSMRKDKKQKKIASSKAAPQAGLCSEDRSMISPDYARNFICDFIIGKEQLFTQMTLF